MKLYADYKVPDTDVKEYMSSMSDGSSIKIIEFIPDEVNAEDPVVIFVAGWISLISGWKEVLREITPRFRTLYVETREKSSSVVPDPGKNSFSMSRLKEDISAVISQSVSDNKGFVLIGSSLGATAILEYCSGEERDPLCAILIAPNSEFCFPVFFNKILPFIPPSLYLIIKPVIKWYLRNFRVDKKKEPEQIKKYEMTLDFADPHKLKANAVALSHYSVMERLSKVEIPCLILGASSDTLHSTEGLECIVERIRRTEYIELQSNKETHSSRAGRIIAEYIKDEKYRLI